MLALTAGAARADVSSTFDASAEGWTHVSISACDGAVAPAPAPAWLAAGGNPGGFLRLTAPSEGNWSYWNAPDAFDGDRSAFAGGQLSFDLRSNQILVQAFNCGPAIGDVELVGAGQRIEYDIPGGNLAANVWHHLSVPLTPAGWFYVGTAHTAVTASDFAAVLAGLTGVRIRAEWSTAIDTDDLDNVVLAGPPGPASLTLDPATATEETDTTHCVTATVLEADGDPGENATVRFATSGATSTSGSSTTGVDGTTSYCFQGPVFAGTSTIDAYADSDGDTTQDPGEPSATATVTWNQPTSGASCKQNGGGRLLTTAGAKGTFGGNAKVAGGVTSGSVTYRDHGHPGRTIHAEPIDSLICSDGAAMLFATTDDGIAVRVDVTDGGEPGSADTFRIRTSDGYDSGVQTISGGNIQVRT
jgi:hypothetical protein